MDRRGFLRGQLAAVGDAMIQVLDQAVVSMSDGARPLRPPGALDEGPFLLTCQRSHACVQACPKGAIKVLGAGKGAAVGTPYIDPLDKPCYLCLECTKVCPSGALTAITDPRQVQMGKARLQEDTCWAYNGQFCQVCYNQCPLKGEAITLDQEGRPVIHGEACVGCGVCLYVCVNSPPCITLSVER